MQPVERRRQQRIDFMEIVSDGNGKTGVGCSAMGICGPKFEKLAEGINSINSRLDDIAGQFEQMNSSLAAILTAFGPVNRGR